MSNLIGILEYAKIIVDRFANKDEIAVDMTLGKGKDCQYLAQRFKKVFAFDIQAIAIEISKERMADLSNVEYINDSHEFVSNYVKESISVVQYNLGYLPQYDQSITTLASSTIKSLETVIDLLKVRGIIIISIYPDHPTGKIEAQAIEEYLAKLNNAYFNISKYCMMNKSNAPYVITIQKLKNNLQ